MSKEIFRVFWFDKNVDLEGLTKELVSLEDHIVSIFNYREKNKTKVTLYEIIPVDVDLEVQAIVNDHDETYYQDERFFLIYSLLSPHKTIDDKKALPFDINYKTEINSRLHPVHTFIHGELQETIYYLQYDEETKEYSDKILRVTFTYIREGGFAKKRIANRTWFYNDGSESIEHKTCIKYYSNLDAIVEGKRRRSNIINEMSLNVVGYLMAFEGLDLTNATLKARTFGSNLKTEITLFIDESIKDLITEINDTNLDSTFPFLLGNLGDMTVREKLVFELNI